MYFSSRIFVLYLSAQLLFPAVCFSQLPSARCDSSNSSLATCPHFAHSAEANEKPSLPLTLLETSTTAPTDAADTATSTQTVLSSDSPAGEHFHWSRALKESFTFLLIEQAYVIHGDFSWVVSERGVPFNHYWRDYTQSLSAWTRSGWNDGDPNWFGYVGHPVQGALTGFIQIQNDPASRALEFSKTRAYWKSRFKAFLWNAAYSTQWNLGPLSEVTVEKYGTKTRPPWNYNGSFPCSHHCLTGVGQIDLVMTPLGGTGWLIGEDFLDSKVLRRLEASTQNHILIDTARCALNPLRGGANILHGEVPWYRASRDVKKIAILSDDKKVALHEQASTALPNHGNMFFGYSHIGTAKCQKPIAGNTVTCNSVSAAGSDLAGWNASVERQYFRFFGAVADFGQQYGTVRESDYLFGLRGGAWVGRVRPFAEAMIGGVRVQENAFGPDTSFAEALGFGVDVRIMRRLAWRIEADRLKTALAGLEQQNLRLSSGIAIRF